MSFWDNFKKLVSKWASANDAQKSGIDPGKPPVAASVETAKPASEAPPALPPATPPPAPTTEQGDGLPSVIGKLTPKPTQPKQELVPTRDYTAQDVSSVISSVGSVLGNLSNVLSNYFGKSESKTSSGGDLLADNRDTTSRGNGSSIVNDSSEVVD